MLDEHTPLRAFFLQPIKVARSYLYACCLFLIRVFQDERFNRFLRFFASLINNDETLGKCYLFSYKYKNF